MGSDNESAAIKLGITQDVSNRFPMNTAINKRCETSRRII